MTDIAQAFASANAFTFAIGKDAGDLSGRWDQFPPVIIVQLALHGLRQKCADAHSDVKKDDPAAPRLAREAAEETFASLQAGVWSERGGRISNPVAKHAKMIATLEAQQRFEGMTVNIKTGDVSIRLDSNAAKYFAALAKARKVKISDLDHKAERTRWTDATMRSERVQAEARKRAEADKAADEVSADDLAALGLV